jgi:hypothetical protein
MSGGHGRRCSVWTAMFVLATLQQIEPVDGQVSVPVMCHTRELAFMEVYSEKNRKLFELLGVLEFNQVVILVKSVQRCDAPPVRGAVPATGLHVRLHHRPPRPLHQHNERRPDQPDHGDADGALWEDEGWRHHGRDTGAVQCSAVAGELLVGPALLLPRHCSALQCSAVQSSPVQRSQSSCCCQASSCPPSASWWTSPSSRTSPARSVATN